jgi:putative spermidine/putrescine transport system ATP-binding protein
MISVRPERIVLGPSAPAMPYRLDVRVVSSVFRGVYAAYQLHVPSLAREIYAYRQADGQRGSLSFKAGDVVTAGWAIEDSVMVKSNA